MRLPWKKLDKSDDNTMEPHNIQTCGDSYASHFSPNTLSEMHKAEDEVRKIGVPAETYKLG